MLNTDSDGFPRLSITSNDDLFLVRLCMYLTLRFWEVILKQIAVWRDTEIMNVKQARAILKFSQNISANVFEREFIFIC